MITNVLDQADGERFCTSAKDAATSAGRRDSDWLDLLTVVEEVYKERVAKHLLKVEPAALRQYVARPAPAARPLVPGAPRFPYRPAAPRINAVEEVPGDRSPPQALDSEITEYNEYEEAPPPRGAAALVCALSHEEYDDNELGQLHYAIDRHVASLDYPESTDELTLCPTIGDDGHITGISSYGPAGINAATTVDCWNCGKTGHMSRDCPSPPDESRQHVPEHIRARSARATANGRRPGGAANAPPNTFPRHR